MENPRLNEAVIAALPAPPKGNRVHYFTGALVQGMAAPRGFGMRITASGARAFILNYRLGAREYRFTIGRWPTWNAVRAVREARDLRRRIDRGENPLTDRTAARQAQKPEADDKPVTVGFVIDLFLRRHVRPRLRRPLNYESALVRLVMPRLGETPLTDLRRSHVALMLDAIADSSGPVMADKTLGYFSACLNWYANERDDEYTPPRLSRMKRAGNRARERVLSDDEIRKLWPVLDQLGTSGAATKVLLLTGQRRGDVYGMRWSEIEGDEWVIPGARYKTGREHTVPLVPAVKALIDAQPHRTEYVFANRDGGILSGGGNHKTRIDKASGVRGWVIHDLRRTARTLLSRAGVRPEIAERVVGHTIKGVEAVYDRYGYLDEKRDALERLASLIERITNPPGENVVAIRNNG